MFDTFLNFFADLTLCQILALFIYLVLSLFYVEDGYSGFNRFERVLLSVVGGWGLIDFIDIV